MRIYPLLTSRILSQSLSRYVLLRGLNARITDTMSYNCSFETAAQYPIYDYLGSLNSPIIDATDLNSTFVVRGNCAAEILCALFEIGCQSIKSSEGISYMYEEVS